MLLLRQPAGRVIQVTSLPLLPQLADYYFTLMAEADPAQRCRDRQLTR
jgi:hypothetical protein